jgi:adenylyltransferase/sulfurtransferase
LSDSALSERSPPIKSFAPASASSGLIDRDFVELSNLQRQSLFDEEDVRNNLPKAAAAEAKLRRVNSSIQIEAIVDDVNPANIEDYVTGVDLFLDALDNFETRFVVNDACAKHRKPWIYTAAVGSYGLVMPVLPGTTPCLRCLLGALPAPGTSPTCETAGVIAPITHIIASMQVAEALKFLTGNLDPSDVRLTAYDVWSHRFQRIDVGKDWMATCRFALRKSSNTSTGTHSARSRSAAATPCS